MENKISGRLLKEFFAKSSDVLIRPVRMQESDLEIYLFCVDGLVDSTLLDTAVLKNFIYDPYLHKCDSEKQVFDYLISKGAYHVFTEVVEDYDELLKGVMSGMAAIIFEGEQKAVIYDIRQFDKRSVSEPQEESVMKGAKDAFVESMRTNTALVRRRIRSEHLVMESLIVGKLSQTDVTIAYISTVADIENVAKIRAKLQNIEIDNIPTSAFVEEHLSEHKNTMFPQVMYTQRPDRVSSNLTDGRIAIIVDGTPFVYLLPCQLPMLMQSPEDYANHYMVGSALRILRYIAMIITLFLPAFYIAATTYQSQMLPVELALSTQAAKQNVPFSSAAEVIGLLIAFEILMEAGLRLPQSVGTAMSILGGIVVGQSAVSANLISPAVVVIVSLAGIAGFIVPNQDLSSGLRLIRFLLSVLAAMSGFFGLTVGLILLILHLCSLDSYGVAYMAPFVDEERNHRDTLFRFPVKYFIRRPHGVAKKNKIKQKG